MGKFYVITSEQTKQYFPEGFAGEMNQVFEELGQRALVVRPPAIKLISKLTHLKENLDEIQANPNAVTNYKSPFGYVLSM